MKSIEKILVLILMASVIFIGCNDDDNDNDDATVYGITTVDLDASKSHIRSEESLIGNMIADAFKDYAESKGESVDFAVANSGNIRFSDETRTDGIYPANLEYTDEIIEEIFPWDNSLIKVKVTGVELKSIFENSVKSLPEDGKGWFLQVSSELKIQVDLSKQRQVLDETDPENPVIATQGERILSIIINNVEYDTTAQYTLAVNSYIAEGGDDFVTFKNIESTLKTQIGEDYREALKMYLQKYSPVTPALEGRITFIE